MKTRIAIVPDLNIDDRIDALATTSGAWAAAGVTALIGGLLTGVTSIVKGAAAGMAVTFNNAGNQEVVCLTKAQKRAGVAGHPAALSVDSITEISEEEMRMIALLRAQNRAQQPVVEQTTTTTDTQQNFSFAGGEFKINGQPA